MTRSEIQLVRSLADKRGRDEHGLFVAEGEKLIGELRASHLRIRKIYALDGVFEGEDGRGANGVIERVTPKEMERLSMLKTPNNSLATVEIPHYGLADDIARHSLVLALDDIQNPGNLGTVIRLADWFGIEDIICSASSADCFNPKVIQATMGAIIRVRVHYTDLAGYLTAAARKGTEVYGTFLEGGDIYSGELTRNGIIVMGNEGRGISPACASAVTRKLFIPPYPADRRGSESLNISIAAAVVCAEFRRRAASK